MMEQLCEKVQEDIGNLGDIVQHEVETLFESKSRDTPAQTEAGAELTPSTSTQLGVDGGVMGASNPTACSSQDNN